jgi:hypothetical protein
MARTLAEMLDFALEDIVLTEAGPVLSTHGGPKVVGMAEWQKAG